MSKNCSVFPKIILYVYGMKCDVGLRQRERCFMRVEVLTALEMLIVVCPEGGNKMFLPVLVTIYKTTQHHTPEDHNQQKYACLYQDFNHP
jgi:hypothetical protein